MAADRKATYLFSIQVSICSYSAADVHRKRSYLIDSIPDIGCIQSAGKKNRHIHRTLTNSWLILQSWTFPVPPRVLMAPFRISTIKKNGIHEALHSQCLCDALFSGDMDDLHNFDQGQGVMYLMVASLKLIHQQSAPYSLQFFLYDQ